MFQTYMVEYGRLGVTFWEASLYRQHAGISSTMAATTVESAAVVAQTEFMELA